MLIRVDDSTRVGLCDKRDQEMFDHTHHLVTLSLTNVAYITEFLQLATM